MEVENEIQFADVSEVFIKDFNKSVDHFENDQLIFVLVNDCNEIQRGVSFINNFVLFVLYKVAHLGLTGDY